MDLHYVGEVNDPNSPARAAFDHVTEGRLQWNSMPEVYDRIMIGGRAYNFPAGVDRFRERMKAYFPGEAAIDAYISAVEAAADASGLFFAEKALPRPIAWVAGRFGACSAMRSGQQPPCSVFSQATIAVLTGQCGDYGRHPARAALAFTPSSPATISAEPHIQSEARRQLPLGSRLTSSAQVAGS